MMWLSDDLRFLLLKDDNLRSLAHRTLFQTFSGRRARNFWDQCEAFLKQPQRKDRPMPRRILVFNQTCRCVTLRFESQDGVVAKAVGTVMSAHPMGKFVLGGITAATQRMAEVMVWPGDLVCLDVPLAPRKETVCGWEGTQSCWLVIPHTHATGGPLT